MADVQIIQNSAHETPGILTYILEDLGVPFTIHHADAWPSSKPILEEAGGLVLLGGPMRVHEQDRYPFLSREIRLVEEALPLKIPILGIGLGSQLVAAALGARIMPGRHKEIGWVPITLAAAATGDPLWAGIESPFMAFNWHEDVFDIPMGSVRLAHSAWTYGQAFRHGSNVYGIQFHLETTYPILAGITDACESELAASGMDGEIMTDKASLYIPRLHWIGRLVFSRWAARVAHPAGAPLAVAGFSS
jgi:GMP synthase (glutamine-hydrolysing)